MASVALAAVALVLLDLSVPLRVLVLACCGELAQPFVVRTCSSPQESVQGRDFAA